MRRTLSSCVNAETCDLGEDPGGTLRQRLGGRVYARRQKTSCPLNTRNRKSSKSPSAQQRSVITSQHRRLAFLPHVGYPHFLNSIIAL